MTWEARLQPFGEKVLVHAVVARPCRAACAASCRPRRGTTPALAPCRASNSPAVVTEDRGLRDVRQRSCDPRHLSTCATQAKATQGAMRCIRPLHTGAATLRAHSRLP